MKFHHHLAAGDSLRQLSFDRLPVSAPHVVTTWIAVLPAFAERVAQTWIAAFVSVGSAVRAWLDRRAAPPVHRQEQ